MKKIAIYGDSILKGVMLDSTSNTYYLGQKEIVQNFVKNYPVEIYNSAKFGYTITRGFKQLERDLKKRNKM